MDAVVTIERFIRQRIEIRKRSGKKRGKWKKRNIFRLFLAAVFRLIACKTFS